MSTAGQECDQPFPQAESAPDITANKERDPFFKPSGSTHANSAVIHEGRDRISSMRCLAGWNFSMAFPTGEIQANHCQFCPVSGRKENPSPWGISSGSRTWGFFAGNRDWLSETPPELCFVWPSCLPQASCGGKSLLQGGET